MSVFGLWLAYCLLQKQNELEGTQRVHISAKLHYLRPDRKFKFHLCLESHIVYLYICSNCMVIVAVTTQRYNLASCNSLLLRWSQNIGNGVIFLYISPRNPTSILNLTISSESQWNIDSSDILFVRKYYQLFTNESNTFLANDISFYCRRLDWVCTDRHTHRQTKMKTVYPPVSLHSLGGYNKSLQMRACLKLNAKVLANVFQCQCHWVNSINCNMEWTLLWL